MEAAAVKGDSNIMFLFSFAVFSQREKITLDTETQHKLAYFEDSILRDIALPERFTFPFFYEPHPLAEIAARELQEYLEASDFDHNFGLETDRDGLVIGKMFGVLVVKDTGGRIGYLSAFSGKLAGANDHPKFVPPVFDMLIEDSFFLREQYILNDINQQVKDIETDAAYHELRLKFAQLTEEANREINAFKTEMKGNKQERKKLRQEKKASLSPEEYAEYEAYLIRHSLHDKHRFNVLSENWNAKLQTATSQLAVYDEKIESLKKERREKSAALQLQLFEQYSFLSKDGKTKSLQAIFADTVFGKPPAAAGECATPKLLQYAFLHGYTPLAMAEFWWGASPKSEIRKHKQYYPACTGKCKPILEHMLEGMPMDDNPFLLNPGEGKQLPIVYEDEHFIIVNKPADLLSVPGIVIQDSVYTRLQAYLGDIEPLIIHRLDMATSGLLVVAKTKEAHKEIQRQFLKRTVIKRYTALLWGKILEDEGEISLPLRGDIDDRPRQMVCHDFGKKATTRWKVAERNETTTKVHFWPLTGRTHQLRMHAAHEQGLNAPIIGDDLYGTGADRLHLHAAYLEFTHPVTKMAMKFEAAEEF